MTDEFHGDELAKAIERAVAGPEAMGVCMTALDTYTKTHIDQQMKEAETIDQDVRREMGPVLAEAGHDLTDEEVALLGIRTLVGGSFSFGIFVGLELERGRRAKEAS
jgi:hypothetical protein